MKLSSKHTTDSLPLTKNSSDEPSQIKNRGSKKKVLFAVAAFLVVIIAAIAGSFWWYSWAISPLDSSVDEKTRLELNSGETAKSIGQDLEQKGLIRSALAFELYTRFSGTRDILQAGSYAFAPSQSVEAIVKDMVDGKIEVFNVTIFPGNTLNDIRKTLIEKGFSDDDISTAFSAKYDYPLLVDKPDGATLEGYIFPETYQLQSTDTVGSLLERSFDLLYKKLETENLLSEFSKRDLTIHEALTLASIIHKEVANDSDERQVAQIFYKRLAEDMPLGADATFIYAAELLGVDPRVNIDSPYNTRVVKGLPPGPIANMNLSALQAVANPASGDFLYFVSGDDGTTYFSRTLEEHESNTEKYCKENCALF